jgi:hypothetical protein
LSSRERKKHATSCEVIRQHTSAYVSIRQHTSRERKKHATSCEFRADARSSASIRQHTSAHSIRQHTCEFRADATSSASIQHTSAYVSTQHTSAYLRIQRGVHVCEVIRERLVLHQSRELCARERTSVLHRIRHTCIHLAQRFS